MPSLRSTLRNSGEVPGPFVTATKVSGGQKGKGRQSTADLPLVSNRRDCSNDWNKWWLEQKMMLRNFLIQLKERTQTTTVEPVFRLRPLLIPVCATSDRRYLAQLWPIFFFFFFLHHHYQDVGFLSDFFCFFPLSPLPLLPPWDEHTWKTFLNCKRPFRLLQVSMNLFPCQHRSLENLKVADRAAVSIR